MPGGIRVRSEWRGNRILARTPVVGQQAVRRVGYDWFARTQAVVPLEEGTLERSGKVEVSGMKVTVAYGTPYGLIQHEREDFQHAPGRTAKYITSVMPAMTARQILAEELRRLFR